MLRRSVADPAFPPPPERRCALEVLQTRFHDDLRRLLAERGWSAQRAGLAAGLSRWIVALHLRKGTYPSPDSLIRLAEVLDAPADTLIAWQAEEAKAHKRDLKPRNCGWWACGRTFRPRANIQVYCRRSCKAAAEARPRADTPLKNAFLAQLRKRQETYKDAATATGLKYGALQGWLLRPKGRLQRRNLIALAGWLGITADAAVQLQGGTAEGSRRTAALNALASVKLQAYMKRLKSDSPFRRRVTQKMSETRRGKPKSTEAKRRISESHRARTTFPNADTLTRYATSMRGKAISLLANYRRWRPKLSARELEQLVVDRLMQPPYSLGSERAARVLLATAHKVESGAGGGRPRHAQRHRIALEAHQQAGILPADHKPYGFWKPVDNRLRDEAPDERAKRLTDYSRWWTEHLSSCVECGLLQAAPENTSKTSALT